MPLANVKVDQELLIRVKARALQLTAKHGRRVTTQELFAEALTKLLAKPATKRK